MSHSVEECDFDGLTTQWGGIRSAPLGAKRYFVTPSANVPKFPRKRLNLELFHAIHEHDVSRVKDVFTKAEQEGYEGFINDKNKRSGTPLMWCCIKNTDYSKTTVHAGTEIMQLLISQKPELDLRDGKGESALMKSAAFGCVSLTGLLLRAHWKLAVGVNGKNKKGQTALILSCRKGYLPVVRSFLNSSNRTKLDLDMVDNDGCSALMTACKHGFADVVTMLLKHGKPPNVNLMNKRGMTALMESCRKGAGGTACVDALLRYGQKTGVGMDRQDMFDGSTSLMWCLVHKNFKTASLLLAHDPRPSMWIINQEGMSAVDAARWRSRPALTSEWQERLRAVLYQQIEPAIRNSATVEAASMYVTDLTQLIVSFAA